MTPLDPAPIVDLMEAFRRSKAMFTAVGLGVFDALLELGRPVHPDELALRFSVDAGALGRLLEACASLSLLTRDAEGRFANTPLAQTFLTRASEHSLTGYVRYSDTALYSLFGNLEDAVREGSARWQQTFGWPAPIFEHFFSTPEKMREFILGMHGFGVSTSPAIAGAFDLSRFHVFADLGAATGHLAIAACEAWPNLQGIVFDLDRVIPLAEEQLAKSTARARLSTHAGDFFTSPLPAADLYGLGRILHDWGEGKIQLLLSRVFGSLPSGGALLIAEKLLAEDRTGPVSACMQSLSMLVCTEGRERTLSEYEALLRSAGFARIEAHRTGRYPDAILATKN